MLVLRLDLKESSALLLSSLDSCLCSENKPRLSSQRMRWISPSWSFQQMPALMSAGAWGRPGRVRWSRPGQQNHTANMWVWTITSIFSFLFSPILCVPFCCFSCFYTIYLVYIIILFLFFLQATKCWLAVTQQ